MNYIITYTSNSLSHNGIKGQKWGVRNGPPYPLNNSDRSASEKKQNLKSFSELQKDYSLLEKSKPSFLNKRKYAKLQQTINDAVNTEAVATKKKELSDVTSMKWQDKAEEFVTEYVNNNKEFKKLKDEEETYAKNFIEAYKSKHVNEFSSEELDKNSKKALEDDETYNTKAFDTFLAFEQNEYDARNSKTYRDLQSEDAIARAKAIESEPKKKEEVIGTVLNELGYEDTKEARDYIQKFVRV